MSDTPSSAPDLEMVLLGSDELARGHQGSPVRKVQTMLNDAGARPPLPSTGIFDADTESAVRAFQRLQGIPESGIVDRQTLKLLQRALEEKAPAKAAAAKRSPGFFGPGDLSTDETERVQDLVKGSLGMRIDPRTRERLEAELGMDLTGVMVHNDRLAHEAAEAIRSEAFTLAEGSSVHIYFARGRYAPGTPPGDRLLIHELTHARQAKMGLLAAGTHKKSTEQKKGDERSPQELEAERAEKEAEKKQKEAKKREEQKAKEEEKKARDDGKAKEKANAPRTLHDVRTGKAAFEEGHEGEVVKELQRLLNDAGAKPPLPIDGKVDHRVTRAIKDFQREQALPRTGVCDKVTLVRLEGQSQDTKGRAKPEEKTPTIHEVQTGKAVLKEGHKGQPVKELQQALNAAGQKDTIAVDGVYGTRTAKAVRQFQREQGLAATGACDKATLQRLHGQSQVEVKAAAKRIGGFRGPDELTVKERLGLEERVRGSLGLRLDPVTKGQMEAELETDLSSILIHTDRIAADAAEAVHAEAFTLVLQGQVHIYFAQGRYSPGTPGGMRLLRHELVHARQARRGLLPSGGARKETGPGRSNAPHELEAEKAEKGPAKDTQKEIQKQRDEDLTKRAPTDQDLRTGQAELARGHQGPTVRTLQEALNAAGCDPAVAVTGRFDQKTEAGVQWFQRSQGLTRTGTANRETWTRLLRAADTHEGRAKEAERAPSVHDVLNGKGELKKGHEGEQVRALQKALNASGRKSPISESGVFDARTEEALKDYQREQGLRRTGLGDKATLQSLFGQSQVEAKAAAKRAPGHRGPDALTLAETESLRGMVEGSIGRRLDAPTKERMEKELGVDLSAVLIHTDRVAGEAARAVNAEAFTLVLQSQVHIYFGHGLYKPGTPMGDRLLLHELTHARQAFRGLLPAGASAKAKGRGPSGLPHEIEADRMEEKAEDKEKAKAAAIAAERDKDLPRRAPEIADVRLGKAELSRGHEGPAVRAVQAALNASGCKPAVLVDGRYTQETERAVAWFRREQGLPLGTTCDRHVLQRLEGQYEPTKIRGEKDKKAGAAAKRETGHRGPEALSLGEVESVRELVKGSIGRRLDPVTRERMEAELQTDLTGVLIHDDRIASEAARAVSAEAFTLAQQGQVHIYFGQGKYKPGTPGGDRLLLHELTHARQAFRGLLGPEGARRALGRPAHGARPATEIEAENVERAAGGGGYDDGRAEIRQRLRGLRRREQAKEAQKKSEEAAAGREQAREHAQDQQASNAERQAEEAKKQKLREEVAEQKRRVVQEARERDLEEAHEKRDGAKETAGQHEAAAGGKGKKASHDAARPRVRFEDVAMARSVAAAEDAIGCADLLIEIFQEQGLRENRERPEEERRFLFDALQKVSGWLDALVQPRAVLDAGAAVAYLVEQGVSPEACTPVVDRVSKARVRAKARHAALDALLRQVYNQQAPRGAGPARPGTPIAGVDAVRAVLDRMSRDTIQRSQIPPFGKDPREHPAEQRGRGWKPSFQTARGVRIEGAPTIGIGHRILERAEYVRGKHEVVGLGGGEPLPKEVRKPFEEELQTDLSGVRIHRDRDAGEAARGLKAHAFTVGDHIYFAPGRYDPDSPEGRRLLGHELRHAVQAKQERAREEKQPSGPQGRADAWGRVIGDTKREREALAYERALEKGLPARATIRQVVADTTSIEPLTPELRNRANNIARRAAARAARILSDMRGGGDAPYFIDEIDIPFELRPDEDEDDAMLRLCAEIVRRAVGRWRDTPGGEMNRFDQ